MILAGTGRAFCAGADLKEPPAAGVEAHIAKPVVTSNQAILWNALRLGGIARRPAAATRLFATLDG